MSLDYQTQIPKSSEPQILKHSWGIWGLLFAALNYLFIAVTLIAQAFLGRGIGGWLILFAVAGYIAVSIVAAMLIFAHDRALIRDAQVFRRYYPFNALGAQAGEFQYVFSCPDPNVVRDVIEKMDRDININLGWDHYEVMKCTDADRRLIQRDARSFLAWRSGKSRRGGSVVLLARASQKGTVCSVQWWVLFSGVIDKGRVRVFIANAPFSLPFWIYPWLRGRHNVAAGLRQLHSSFYESMDIITLVKSVQKICLDALITTLEKHGIDISDLKDQVASVMNISIAGGQNTFGNVVQGHRNTVAAAPAQGGKSAG